MHSLLKRTIVHFYCRKYSTHPQKLRVRAKKLSSDTRVFQRMFQYSDIKNTLPLIIILTLCGSFRGRGCETEAFGQSSPSLPPSFFPSLNIYYQANETTSNSRLHHASQTQGYTPKTTETNVRKASFDLFTNSSPPTMILNETTNVIHRFLRQIVPLPTTTARPKGIYSMGGVLSISPNVQKLIQLYQVFLIDYAISKGWNHVQFIVPQQVSLALCQHFAVGVQLSESSLKLDCYNDSKISELIHANLKRPIILADFLSQNRLGKGSFKRSPIDSRLLVANKKILLLTRNESLDEIVNSAQLELLVNYKWVLGKEKQTNGSEKLFELYKVYGFATSFNPLYQQIGTWSNTQGLQIDAAKDTGIADFQGQMLRVTTVAV